MNPGRGDDAVELPPEGESITARAVPVEDLGVERLLAVGEHPLVVWRQPGGPAIAAANGTASIRAAEADRFQRVRDWAAVIGDRVRFDGPAVARPRFLGGFAFADTTPTAGRWAAFPPAWFVLPRVQLVREDEETWVTVTTEGDEPPVATVVDRLEDGALSSSDGGCQAVPPLGSQRPVPTRSRWLGQVREIQDEINAGQFRKAVLGHTTEASLATAPAPASLDRRLRESHPVCYRFLLAPAPDTLFLGASPERLVEGDGHRLRTDALAGSVRRGNGPAADRELAAMLRESPKDAFEHDVVVEAIRDRLAGCCRDVSTGDRSIRQLDAVQHLHTEITATRSSDCHLLDVAETLHPTPAVGGLPRAPALATLDRVESFDRGWYAGPIGWFDRDGNGQFAIGIRSAVVDAGEAVMFAGAGIVADSDPADEWDELQLKYQPIRSIFGER